MPFRFLCASTMYIYILQLQDPPLNLLCSETHIKQMKKEEKHHILLNILFLVEKTTHKTCTLLLSSLIACLTQTVVGGLLDLMKFRCVV